MFILFSGLLRSRQPVTSRVGVTIQQRVCYINSKPPKENIGPVETGLALTVITVAILGPAAWILANLDHYKSRG